MTRRNARPRQKMGLLNGLLAVGAVAATLVGTYLLSLNEEGVESSDPLPNPVITIAPMSESSLLTNRPDRANVLVIDLAPLPQLVKPDIQPIRVQPVTRTRSS